MRVGILRITTRFRSSSATFSVHLYICIYIHTHIHIYAWQTNSDVTHVYICQIEREFCLLVLDTVISTPQWRHQPKPRGCVFVFVCKYVLGRFRATQPPNLRLCLLRHCGFLTSPHAIPTRSGCHPNSCRLFRRSTSAPHLIPRAHFLHLPTSPRLSQVPCFFYGVVESKESGHRLCRD
jgi:hypothetical protein